MKAKIREQLGPHLPVPRHQAFNAWLQIPDEKREKIGEVVEMLHNASLMIDDIEDDSILRRGIPVAHKVYGVPHTINSANYVYFLGLQKVRCTDALSYLGSRRVVALGLGNAAGAAVTLSVADSYVRVKCFEKKKK